MEKIKFEVNVHGNAVRVNPGMLVTPFSDHAQISLKPGDNQLHFPIPTPAVKDGQRLRAGKLYIRFSTSQPDENASQIRYIRVFDGDKHILSLEDLGLKGIGAEAAFDFPGGPVPVNWGVNMTVGVAYNKGPAAIDIIAVGIDFHA